MTHSAFKALFTIAIMTLCGCKLAPSFLYKPQADIQPLVITQTHKIHEIIAQRDIDILWVIDNSPSMGKHHDLVIQHLNTFIDEFISKSKLNWRIGIISTDTNDEPYIGLTQQTRVDHNTQDQAQLLREAVGRLGVIGDAEEKLFDPMIKALKNHPDFLRESANLALLFLSDEPEQSRKYPSADVFLNELSKLKPLKYFSTYGTLAAPDLGCPPFPKDWNFCDLCFYGERPETQGGRYEKFLNLTQGKLYILCKDDFGRALAEISSDIIKRANPGHFFLDKRPVISTIRVTHRDQELPGGSDKTGGVWVYNPQMNAIAFSELAFSIVENDEVQVTYLEDIGIFD